MNLYKYSLKRKLLKTNFKVKKTIGKYIFKA